MNNEMHNLNKVSSFVQKTQKFFVIFVIFPFISSGEHEISENLRKLESTATMRITTQLLGKLVNESGGDKSRDHSWTKYWGLSYYKLSNNKPVWTDGFVPNVHAASLVELVSNAHNYGLFPEKLNANRLLELEEALASETNIDRLYKLRAHYEIAASGTALKFISQLNRGIVATDSLFHQYPRNGDSFTHCRYYLYESLTSSDFKNHILKAQPRNKPYESLQIALKNWLARVELSNTFITLHEENMLPSLCNALNYHGYRISVEETDSIRISNIIKSFQRGNGLTASGLLTEETKNALQRSNYENFLQIAINLERLKTERIPLTSELVFVNIPSYQVKIIRKGKIEKMFKAVVGKPLTPTPVITSKIEKIVTCPKWYVPRSIATREIFHKMKNDSMYLEKRNFRLLDRGFNEVAYNELDWNAISPVNFDYKLMQQPGSSNALGKLKFLFPNPYSVYLHDTPAKRYFKREARAYSHGCVRLDNPEQFADYLLSEIVGKEDIPSVNQFIRNGQTREIQLEHPVDIAIRYLTCDADEHENLVFLKDIYQKDQPIIEQILN